MGITDILNSLFVFVSTLGYIGLFTISFIASIIVFVPVPFFPILALMSIDKDFDPHILAFSSAIGATLAKTIIFYSSFYGRRFISRESKVKMKPLQRLLKRYGWYASFIAAATPIPDDIVYIPLGLVKYNPWLFFTSCFAGKMVISEAIVWGTRTGFNMLEYLESNMNGELFYATVIATIAVTAFLIYLMIKTDWSRLVGKVFPWTLKDDNDDNNDANNLNNYNNRSNQ